MRRGLIGDDVGPYAAPDQLGENLRRIAEHADRESLSLAAGLVDHGQRLVEILRLLIEVAGLESHLDTRGLALDREQRGARHGGGQRLCAAHAAETGGEDPSAGEVAAVMAAPDLGEGLVGTLHDPLRADVDPRAGRHLAEHHQALAIKQIEMIERRPMRHQVGVGDQHARRIRMRAENADRLAGLHAQGLITLERGERGNDAVVARPIARRAADATIDHKLVRFLGDLGIEIVHEHTERRFGLPALGGELAAVWRPDVAGVVETQAH